MSKIGAKCVKRAAKVTARMRENRPKYKFGCILENQINQNQDPTGGTTNLDIIGLFALTGSAKWEL